MSNKYTVVFRAEGNEERSTAVSAGETILEAAKQAKVPLDAPCSGNGTCGKCRVKVLSGESESGQTRHISREDYAQGYRLACTSAIRSDMVVFVPPGALAYQNRIKISAGDREQAVFSAFREELGALGFIGDSGLEILDLTLSRPDPGNPMADRERLLSVLETLRGEGAPPLGLSLYAQRKLPDALREGDFSVSCVLRHGAGEDLILNVFPRGPSNPVIAGLAIDIGTTSVSILLLDLLTGEPLALGSAGNGQIRYGADVISRIIESTRPGGLERLQRAVLEECMVPLIQALCRKGGISPDAIYRAAVAANTTMTHLFLGVNPAYLRLEPYVPAFFEGGTLRGSDTGLCLHPDAEVIPAPSIGSYVGGDITAGTFSSGVYKKEALSLLIDLGTNGELVFGNADFLMACACSAGPAFEGGDIGCGMRATDGAVEACGIDRETMEPAPRIIGAAGQKPAGLCGSGLIDLIGELFRCGIINARGKFIREGKRVLRDEWGMAGYIAAFAGETETGRDLVLTEGDIDNFVRAKGAIFSAIRTMLVSLDFTMDAIEEVYIAGGIGSGINVENAIRIGMFPKLPLERYHYIGNSSLLGAYAMAGSRGAVQKLTEISRGMTYLELSSHPGYMDEFVAACFLPHTDGNLFA
ncbi:ASKHA domain-containing protein [Treponema sp. TIM-1]|uniref:corrinoid activation/regeneration protein AcsV n=1 Tax=Treponema sp. TIM-1 TaxID=2898417 RepID=UPI00397EBE6F